MYEVIKNTKTETEISYTHIKPKRLHPIKNKYVTKVEYIKSTRDFQIKERENFDCQRWSSNSEKF